MSRPEHLASDDETDTQRRARRDSTLLRTEVRSLDGHAPIQCIVRNLSEGGMMAENAKLYPVGTHVEVELRALGSVAGRVAWTVENRMGIAFDQPIDAAEARKPVRKSVDPDTLLKTPANTKRVVR